MLSREPKSQEYYDHDTSYVNCSKQSNKLNKLVSKRRISVYCGSYLAKFSLRAELSFVPQKKAGVATVTTRLSPESP